MQGNILTFSTETNTGIITGAGNKRYSFSADDWKENCPVISRVNVDFVAVEDAATEIYCTDTEALQDELEKVAAQKAAEIELAESIKKKENIDKLEKTYGGLYRSSDQALWKGVCAGLAHKTGIPVIIVRALTIYPGIYLFPLYFIFWKKWKCLETKNVYSVGADKFAEKINSAANVFNTLAGGASQRTMGATESASQSQFYTNEKSSISNQSSNNNNSSYSSPKTQNSGLNSPKFNSRTAVAIAGAIILERGKFDGDDTYRYCHKCESCGHATTNIIQSDKFGLTETINRGKFYCIKCGNLQNVEIQA